MMNFILSWGVIFWCGWVGGSGGGAQAAIPPPPPRNAKPWPAPSPNRISFADSPSPCPLPAFVHACTRITGPAQASLGIGSVNFRTVDFADAFFNWSYCVLCVLSDTSVLRCMMFIFCVKAAELGMMALVAYFDPWVSEQYIIYFCMHNAQCDAQAMPLSKRH